MPTLRELLDSIQSLPQRRLEAPNARQWVNDQVIDPTARAVLSLLGAFDRPPSPTYPENVPYTSPMRILTAGQATMPAAAGVLYDTVTGARPQGGPVVDPMRPPEEQSTFASEAARRGGGNLLQLAGTVGDLVIGPEHGLAGLSAAMPLVKGAKTIRKAASLAAEPAKKAARLPKTARPAVVAEKIIEGGGYTVHPTTGATVAQGQPGPVMVGKFPNSSNRTMVIPEAEFGPQHVQQFMRRNADVFKKDKTAHVGGWKSEGQVYLDVSVGRDDVRAATKVGELQNPGANPKPWTAKQKAAGIPRQWESTGIERREDGTWPKAQEAVFDPMAPPDTYPPVGNFSEFVQSLEMQNRLDEMAKVGHGEMGDTKTWWDLRGGPIERVYGPERLEKIAGYMASTSPQNGPVPNMQMASELMRRDIKGEPVSQPTWRSPETAMGPAEPGSGFTPKAGDPMPGTNTWKNNATLVRAGRGSEIRQDKVNDMRRALLGDLDVAVIDRHYAKIAEAPERGVFTDAAKNKVAGAMDTGMREAYPEIENAVRTGAKRAGVDLSHYSAWVWEGIRSTIKKTGQLFGQQHRASAIPDTVGGFNQVFDDLVAKKAAHLGVTVPELESRLGRGDAELLAALLSTSAGAEAYRRWSREDPQASAPGAAQ